MNIKEVLTTLNRLQADGVVGPSAIGGAVAATFYLEPVSTLDVDVFVTLTPPPGSVLLSLDPEQLQSIISRHQLVEQWQLFIRQFIENSE